MNVQRLKIPDVLLITPTQHTDARGFVSEVYRADLFSTIGINAVFVQDNHSYSNLRGALRGLHLQKPPRSQGKLVRCTRGAVLDVVVDVRPGSSTFGSHASTELSAANWRQIWIPPGFAHGFVTLEAESEIVYKTTDYYDSQSEVGIAWNDPALGIDWRFDPADITLSAKDRDNPNLADMAALRLT